MSEEQWVVHDVRALGIHLDPGTAWLAAVDTAGKLVHPNIDRIELPTGVASAERALAEFHESASELMRRYEPDVLAILEAGTSQNPPPAAASRSRGHLEGALMLAADETGVRIAWVAHADVGRAFGVRPADRALAERLADRLGGAKPVRWASRAKAFAAALVVREGHCG